MVTMVQSAANWRSTHTHVYRTHSLTHVRQHCYNHFVRSASSATPYIYTCIIWNRIFFEGTLITANARENNRLIKMPNIKNNVCLLSHFVPRLPTRDNERVDRFPPLRPEWKCWQLKGGKLCGTEGCRSWERYSVDTDSSLCGSMSV